MAKTKNVTFTYTWLAFDIGDKVEVKNNFGLDAIFTPGQVYTVSLYRDPMFTKHNHEPGTVEVKELAGRWNQDLFSLVREEKTKNDVN